MIFDDAACLRRRDQKVGLAAEESRDLQHVDDGRNGRALPRLVHVSHYRQLQRLADLGKHPQRRLEPDAALARERGAVRLVERGLEDQPEPELAGDLLEGGSHLECVRAALHLARAREHRDRCVVRNLHAADKDARIGLQRVVLAHRAL